MGKGVIRTTCLVGLTPLIGKREKGKQSKGPPGWDPRPSGQRYKNPQTTAPRFCYNSFVKDSGEGKKMRKHEGGRGEKSKTDRRIMGKETTLSPVHVLKRKTGTGKTQRNG